MAFSLSISFRTAFQISACFFMFGLQMSCIGYLVFISDLLSVHDTEIIFLKKLKQKKLSGISYIVDEYCSILPFNPSLLPKCITIWQFASSILFHPCHHLFEWKQSLEVTPSKADLIMTKRTIPITQCQYFNSITFFVVVMVLETRATIATNVANQHRQDRDLLTKNISSCLYDRGPTNKD